jgi:AcrR family transcriptional regulator
MPESEPGKKELTHERIVEVASRAIRRAGYQGVGVADVMREAGLTHGGFYAHFRSRDALLVEAVEHAGRENARVVAERVAKRRAAGEDPFTAFVNVYLSDEQLVNVERGCVVAALISETPRQDQALRDCARARVKDLVDAVTALLPRRRDPAEATLVVATMVGALQLARTLGGKGGRSLLAATRASLLEQYAI